MDTEDRIAKKVREARILRAASPQRTLEMGFGMMVFGRTLPEAADRARPR